MKSMDSESNSPQAANLLGTPQPTPNPMLKAIFGRHLARKPFIGQLLASLVFGSLLFAASLGGLAYFLTSDWFHDPGPYAQNKWEGYTARQFVGLCFFTFCATGAFTFLYVATQTASRTARSATGLTLYGTLGAACILIGAVGMAVWGRFNMECLALFCVNVEKYPEHKDMRPEAGLGWLSVVGSTAFFALIPVGLIILWSLMQRIRNAYPQHDEDAEATTTSRTGFANGEDPHTVKKAGGDDGHRREVNDSSLSSSSRFGYGGIGVDTKSGGPPTSKALEEVTPRRLFAIAIPVVLFLFVFGFIITAYIPNNWEYFTAPRIAANARKEIGTDGAKCNEFYKVLTCPEARDPVFRTKQIKVSEHLYLKYYPGNVFFFTYLIVVVLGAALIRSSSQGRRLLQMLVVPRTRITLGELLFLAATFLMVVMFFFYWAHDHNYNGYWTGQRMTDGVAPSERWARSFGQLAVLLLSLLMFPASRSPTMHYFFGTSWESQLYFHRLLGYGMLVASFLHMVVWYVKYNEVGVFPRDIFDVPNHLPTSIDNFTVPLSTLGTWLTFICMGVLALDFFRRKHFEVFYYAHLFAAYSLIPIILWHAQAGWEYMLPGVTVWFADRCLRLFRSAREVEIIDIFRHESRMSEIRFRVRGGREAMQAKLGQYVFVNIAEISLFEWHPFTISSPADADYYSIHVRSMGRETWTDRLYVYLSEGHTNVSLAVDGPYGHSFCFGDYQRVVLIGGGIGITPCANIFSGLKHAPHVTQEVVLVWSTRDSQHMEAFKEQLSVAPEHQGHAQSRIFFTRGYSTATKDMLPVGARIADGRPDQEDFKGIPSVANVEESYTHGATLVFVCGPDPLVELAESFARNSHYYFHAETFLL